MNSSKGSSMCCHQENTLQVLVHFLLGPKKQQYQELQYHLRHPRSTLAKRSTELQTSRVQR